MTPDYGCKLIKGQLFFAYDTFCVQIGNKAFQGNLLVMQSYCHQLFSNMGMPLKRYRYRTVIGNSTRVVFSFRAHGVCLPRAHITSRQYRWSDHQRVFFMLKKRIVYSYYRTNLRLLIMITHFTSSHHSKAYSMWTNSKN